jgi:hypothetical protein
MAGTDEELRRELDQERVELIAAVANLRTKVDHAKQTGVKVGYVAAGALGVAAVARLLLSRRR